MQQRAIQGNKLLLLLLSGCTCLLGSGGCETPPRRGSRVADATRWICYYGDDRAVLDLKGVDMFVLDPDSMGDVRGRKRASAAYLAYLCVGEAESFRWYWPQIQGADWLVRENPSWPDHYLVDPRSAEWRSLIVERVARRLEQKGYDGFMLDTLDTVEALVSREPLRYEGAAGAMVRLVRELRRQYPDAVIVANGGLAIFPGIADRIDGVIYEGVTWTYDFESHTYRARTPGERARIENRLERVRRAGLPIYALDYVNPQNGDRAERVRKTLRQEGFRPFVTGVNLDWYPGQESSR